MGIEDVLFELRMAREMNLRDALRRNCFQIIRGIEIVIPRRYVNVVWESSR